LKLCLLNRLGRRSLSGCVSIPADDENYNESRAQGGLSLAQQSLRAAIGPHKSRE
jgi:hypothetical protein